MPPALRLENLWKLPQAMLGACRRGARLCLNPPEGSGRAAGSPAPDISHNFRGDSGGSARFSQGLVVTETRASPGPRAGLGWAGRLAPPGDLAPQSGSWNLHPGGTYAHRGSTYTNGPLHCASAGLEGSRPALHLLRAVLFFL